MTDTDRADDRVRAYLKGLDALPHDFRNDEAVDACFDEESGETRTLTIGDLRVLVQQAEALCHTAPDAARIIEHTLLTEGTTTG